MERASVPAHIEKLALVHGAKSLPYRRVADLRATVQFSRMLLPLIVTSEFAFTLILRLP